jgi:PEP-CTERM motif
MKTNLRVSYLFTLLFFPLAAHAGLIGSYGTGSTAAVTGGSFSSDTAIHDVFHPAYFRAPHGPVSNWVWGDDPTGRATIQFNYDFDLTGYDIYTAALAGVWGADNIGAITLNGNLLSELPTIAISNFYTPTTFAANTASLFNQGANRLQFSITNAGGVGAFRSSGTLSAELAPVLDADAQQAAPVPAPGSLALAMLGLAALGFNRRRKA